jgi:hypothetical protein
VTDKAVEPSASQSSFIVETVLLLARLCEQPAILSPGQHELLYTRPAGGQEARKKRHTVRMEEEKKTAMLVVSG